MFTKSITQKKLYAGMFIVSLTATLGSLYFSEIVGLTPCTLCWYQRILMYPLAIMTFIGFVTNSRELPRFVLPFTLSGIVLSLYHYAIQMLERTPANTQLYVLKCTTSGEGCTATQIIYFGFITIPFLAAIAFALISAMAILCLRRKDSQGLR